MAQELSDEHDRRQLTAYGTLYRALGRLEDMGLLESRWEDPHVAMTENRPPRRLYTLTPDGHAVVEAEHVAPAPTQRRRRRRLAPA